MLELRQALAPGLLERAIQQLMIHHDALRLRFERDDQRWRQFTAGSEETMKLALVDLAGAPEREQTAAMECTAAGLQAGLQLSQGPIVRAALFDLVAERPSRLLLVIHHLAVDGVSWRILLEDLQTICLQLQNEGTFRLPPEDHLVSTVAQKLTEHGRTATLRQEVDYWLDVSPMKNDLLPVDFRNGENTEGSACTVSAAWMSKRLARCSSKFRMRTTPRSMMFFCPLCAIALSSWIGQPTVRINLEGHGARRTRRWDGLVAHGGLVHNDFSGHPGLTREGRTGSSFEID